MYQLVTLEQKINELHNTVESKEEQIINLIIGDAEKYTFKDGINIKVGGQEIEIFEIFRFENQFYLSMF